ncbi:MAG: hypothetical protein ACI9VS_000238 [Candidatus Binatia bacterium]|jgi:hypothetical protein
MSYFDYPRLYFSGRFKASPSTINNTPNNYDPLVYPTPNELQDVELYWNPKGDGGFALVDCKVTRVDYADGTSATSADEDPIVGQKVASIQSPSFPLEAGLVDLDPMQQNVSEIWAMTVQIGADTSNLTGKFAAISFYSIWGQAQGKKAPHSSASGSGVYQSTLKNTKLTGDAGASKFLQHFAANPTAEISLNFNVNTHNNSAPIWSFNGTTFEAMRKAALPVPDSVLTKIQPLQRLIQNVGSNLGDIPAQDFVLFMLQQYLTKDEFNANIDTIMATTESKPYTGSTTEPFLYGLTTGAAGPTTKGEPNFFVRNRMMCPQTSWISQQAKNPCYFAPFVTSACGKSIIVNLGNSLPTDLPGNTPYSEVLGDLWLVKFPPGEVFPDKATKLVQIPYSADFLTQTAGLFSATLDEDVSGLPLGILSVLPSGSKPAESIVLAENKDGYYLRSDQFVYRMNPGVETTPDFPRGETASVDVHVLQYGQPVADGTQIAMTMMSECQAYLYTESTLGTGGTRGIENLSLPQDALQLNGQTSKAIAVTKAGVATFDLSCTPPGNPRKFVDGQVYFLNYGFKDPAISAFFIQDPNDIVSVLVFDETAELPASEILAKFGRLYKIMSFLTDKSKVEQIDLRNMIKLLLEKPFTELEHMPVTRDLGAAARDKIVSWINELNQS